MNPLLHLLAVLALASSAPAASRPNILLIVSDDQGYADAGFQGSKDIRTPQLDRLAKSGLRCTNGYVSHPFCSPTRAGLMSGRYQQRFGHENNPFYDPADTKEGLPLTERLLPDFLKAGGYTTGWVGKWHLGAHESMVPAKRGFQECFGFLGGGHRFRDWKVGPGEYNIPLCRDGEPVPVEGHLTTQCGSEAVAFVKRHTEAPWFLYLAFNAPHSPQEPTPEARARYADLPGPRGAYAAQISLLDDAVGSVIGALESTGQRERTLVFFFSDNGGPPSPWKPDNSPLRGFKGDVFEGGVRVPFVVSWPSRLPAGKDYTLPVSSLDVFATSLALAGQPRPQDKKYDSVDLLPYLSGEKKESPHDRLFWRTGGGAKLAVREGDWKLVRLKNQPDLLFNLAQDIGEKTDVAAAQPEVVKKLAASLEAWNQELVPPAFPGLGAKRAAKSADKAP